MDGFSTISAPPAMMDPSLVIAESNFASEFYERLTEWFEEFDQSLDPDQEVGVRLVSFGQSLVFYLTDMGFWNPSLIN